MFDILKIVLPTFTVILIGFLLGRFKKIDIRPVTEIVFYVGLPALAFTSVLDKQIVLLDAAKIWASVIIIMLGCGLLAWLAFKILRQKHSGLYIPAFLMNCVNIPFPILYLVYGNEGLFAATLFYIPNMLALYTVGIYLASGKHWKDSLKEVLTVPALYAAIAGLLVNFNHITVPDLVLKPFSVIAMMVVPLVLLVLGCNLATVRLNSISTTLLVSLIRIGGGLLLGMLVVNLFHLTGLLRAVVIFDSAMPAAANGAIITTKYQNEAEMVSSVVFFTTLASLVIIPVLLAVLR
jgi:malate permease and related proteins